MALFVVSLSDKFDQGLGKSACDDTASLLSSMRKKRAHSSRDISETKRPGLLSKNFFSRREGLALLAPLGPNIIRARVRSKLDHCVRAN